MGAWQSYKRLSKSHRLILGFLGIGIGLSGPTLLSWIVEGKKPNNELQMTESQQQEEKIN